jgi:hypothetical protein
MREWGIDLVRAAGHYDLLVWRDATAVGPHGLLIIFGLCISISVIPVFSINYRLGPNFLK